MILADAEATAAIGRRLAELIDGGETIALVGDLGAGKTTLTAALVDALGGGPATSPTFSLVNRYDGGHVVVWHVDLYRIEDARELEELGLDDAIGNPVSTVIIEWADKFPQILPADHLVLTLAHVGDTRRLTAAGTGPRSRELAAALTVGRASVPAGP